MTAKVRARLGDLFFGYRSTQADVSYGRVGNQGFLIVDEGSVFRRTTLIDVDDDELDAVADAIKRETR